MTSQIFANIYLDQFDRFVRMELKPLAYVRYGDDFLLFLPDSTDASVARARATTFLREELKLGLHVRNDVIFQARQGAHFLGVEIFPGGRRLKPQIAAKIARKMSLRNFTGYDGLVRQHGSRKQQRKLLRLPDDFMV